MEFNKEADASDFFFLAMADKGRGNKPEAERDFDRGVELASKVPSLDAEISWFWAEAAKVLGKAGPPTKSAQLEARETPSFQ